MPLHHGRRRAVPQGGGEEYDITTLPGGALAFRWDLGAYVDAGITPATDGTLVQEWHDQINGVIAQNAISSRPYFRADGSLDFTGRGSNSQLFVGGLNQPFLGNDCTIIVESTINCPQSFAYHMNMDTSAAPILFRSTGNVDLYYSGSAQKAAGFASGVAFDSTTHSMVLKRTATESFTSWDDGAFTSDALITEPDWSTKRLISIGGYPASGSYSSQAKWRGVVVSTQNLSDEDIANAKSWLRA